MNWEARARELQRQVDDLEFKVENLESALNARGVPFFAGLTQAEEKIAQLLRHRCPNVVTKQQFLDLLYAFRSDGEQPDIKIVDVFICKLRKKFDGLSIDIETAWGRGYFMPTESALAFDAATGKQAA